MTSLILSLCLCWSSVQPEPVHFSIQCNLDPAAICGRSGVTSRDPLLTNCPHCRKFAWYEICYFVKAKNTLPKQGDLLCWPLEGK
jgi:hypothetical protein